jgi:hypothetical protein
MIRDAEPFFVGALPGVGVGVPPLPPANLTPNRRWGAPRRHRPRFSLRTFLLFAALVAVPIGWLGRAVAIARHERATMAALKEKGCLFMFHEDDESPIAVRYALGLLGDDEPWNVSWIAIDGRKAPFGDADMVHLRALTRVRNVWLHSTQVSDAGLGQLEGLTELKWLELQETPTTDAGLQNLKGLTQLKFLNLSETQVTDDGLAQLEGLTRLNSLNLSHTKVTPCGIERLKAALPQLRIASTVDAAIR